MTIHKRFLRLLAAAGLLAVTLEALETSCIAGSPSKPETSIWFTNGASSFIESSPLGNGRLGAMMFGGVDEERIVLNESSVWSGSKQDADRPGASKALPEIRRLLLAGKNVEAEALVNANFTCLGPGSGGAAYGCYQVLGNLYLAFATNANSGSVSGYRRELNLDDAIAAVNYDRGGIHFSREMFVTAPDEVMALRLGADKPRQISFSMRLDRPERFQTAGDGANGLLMTGELESGTTNAGVRYAARVRVLNDGGKVSVTGNVLSVQRADHVLILIAAATDYHGFAGRQTDDPVAQTIKDLNGAAGRSFRSLEKRHIADYQKYFHRASLELGPGDPIAASQPTYAREQALKAGANDPALMALYFNFGRYLLISSSRPGGLPPNLQGIWAEEIHTPWNGDWHLDVNVQMNYWPAEECNLSDFTQPLFALIASLQEPGAKTAHDYYDARGWVAHVIANPWGFTSPGESASWGSTTGGSAWLCQHLYDHYRFTLDRDFLKWAYPIMKGSARFYADMLIEEPKHHWLVVAPANSPENSFILPNGQHASIALGTTVHSQMLRYLFNACIESSKILGIDEDFRKELTDKVARLAPTQIAPDGRLMEWLEDYKETDIHHRHVSHLWGLYPGDEISVETTPALAEAARKSLEVRGDDGVGWSLAYKAALWARLDDGNHAWKIVRNALNPVVTQEIHYDNGGGVYPNMFDACPPFQIDGNFGVTAAIGEMLIQSQNDTIHLLPALPDAWREGRAEGFRARGDFIVSMTWKDGTLVSAVIRSEAGRPCRVSYRGKTVEFEIKKGKSVKVDEDLVVVK